jgi:hypothetical protein
VFSWKGAAIHRELQHGSKGIVSVRSRYLARTSEDITNWEYLVCAAMICRVNGAIIKCNYEFCIKVVNKSNIQSNTRSRHADARDSIFNSDNDNLHILQAIPKKQGKVVKQSPYMYLIKCNNVLIMTF